MFPVNILITNFCNQNCTFCFAAQELGSKNIKKEMSLSDFKNVILKLKKEPTIKIVKLLGGEPTLHSQFQEIINFSLKHFPKVQIFTNGIMSPSLTTFLESKGRRVGFTFNVMTPGFLFNPAIRNAVSNTIKRLCRDAEITLSFTFDMRANMELVFKSLGDDIVAGVHGFRLGISNPIYREKNYYTFSDFPKMGSNLYFVVSQIRRNNKAAKIRLNCGFTRCMFTDSQYEYLDKQKVVIPGFGCFGKEASFDLQTDLTAFHCFPLSQADKRNTVKRSFSRVNKDLVHKRFEYWGTFTQKVCKTCPFYGFGKNKCPGPCIAFLMNNTTRCSQ